MTARRADAQSYLMDLVTDTLDPGYAEAARRRQSAGAPAGRGDRLLTALGCLLAGFVLVVALVHANRSAPAAAKLHAGLVSRVSAAQQRADQLTATAATLTMQVDRLRAAALGSGGLQSQLVAQEAEAGTRAVTGPGVSVTLSDPTAPRASATPGRAGTTPIQATHIITDRDVRAIVNQLWAGGAEAIAVNGIRLTATAAIRFAGEAVLVDFEAVSSPYRIDAIGKPDGLETQFADSPVASRYKTLSAAQGIGFSFGQAKALTLPAAAPVAVREATPGR
jgi:uncharacterized protein YlxW (UPF0749 family)